MSIIKEFKEFVMRGNVIDLAVGVVIGAAFGKITTSLVENVMMPPLGILIGGVDFSDLALTLRQATDGQPAVLLQYGVFIQTLINFLIIAASVFIVVKVVNKLQRKQDAGTADAPPPPADVQLLTEIRDLLKQRPL